MLTSYFCAGILHYETHGTENYTMNRFTPWLHAARPKTLPLALASTILGSFLAAAEHRFNAAIFLLASLTTILLQILSNCANDYGDYTNGKDTSQRIGPRRMVQSGEISQPHMRVALIVLVMLTLASGIALIYTGAQGIGDRLFWFVMGVVAIAAAMKYTIGRNPYGYRGWGDLSVFTFFGLTGTIGTYYLHTHHFSPEILLPAASIGFLSTGVLNVNNLRDYHTDKATLKRTVVVMMGQRNAKRYHIALLLGAIVTGVLYTMLNFKTGFQLLFFIAIPFFIKNIQAVIKNKQPAELNIELRNLSLSTLLYSVCFGLGLIL
jgi:1,4-dihydroxy-2-naphthoate polyprenyltransferase